MSCQCKITHTHIQRYPQLTEAFSDCQALKIASYICCRRWLKTGNASYNLTNHPSRLKKVHAKSASGVRLVNHTTESALHRFSKRKDLSDDIECYSWWREVEICIHGAWKAICARFRGCCLQRPSSEFKRRV